MFTWLNQIYMSGDQLIANGTNLTPKIARVKKKSKVNINDLLLRVREEQNKVKKVNYIFVSLMFGAFAVIGIIASF